MQIRGIVFTKAERVLVGILAAMAGIFLTLITGPLSPPDGMINPFWGSVFGIGSAIEYALFDAPPMGVLGLVWGFLGLVLWPVVVLFLLNRLTRYVQNRPPIASAPFYIIFVITICYNVPISRVEGTWMEGLPFFVKYLDFAPR